MDNLTGFPAYVGYWSIGTADYESGSFRMFIDSEKELPGLVKEISGRIKDKYGRSFFEGTISPIAIKFIKKYDPQHSDRDAIKSEILFEGRLSDKINYGKTHYEGKFKVEDNKKTVLEGSFVLEKHIPSRTLEFLMRNDRK